LHYQAFTSGFSDFRCRFFQLPDSPCGGDDIGAGARQAPGHSPAQPASGSRNNRDFAVKSQIIGYHFSSANAALRHARVVAQASNTATPTTGSSPLAGAFFDHRRDAAYSRKRGSKPMAINITIFSDFI
jgi:hypothetical protein